MFIFRDKHILIAVTGSIAAYKVPILIRLFIKEGANVRIIMSESAKEFVTPIVMATLSKNPVIVDFIKKDAHTVDWNNHVDIGLWADYFIVAPATSNTIAKMANGYCDNLLSAAYLSAKSPVFVAPAMDLDMYKHSTTKQNLNKLRDFGNYIISPGEGELASGLYGKGRMAEPEDILEFIKNELKSKMLLDSKKILITAGPTHEAIDPVRFISNYSSGKMGYEIACEASNQGAEVCLISGPTRLNIDSNINLVSIISASDMYDAVEERYKEFDIIIMVAAVADFTPKTPQNQKIKKSTNSMRIELKPTRDILKMIGQNKKEEQFLIGFALETDNAIENAINKLKDKNLDAIVLNSLENKGAGFGTDTNKITIIDKSLKQYPFKIKSKKEVARDIISFVLKQK